MVRLGKLMMFLDLHWQGLSPTAIARQLGIDRKTVRKYIASGMDPPNYRAQPRRPRGIDDFLSYLRERLAAHPGLGAIRLAVAAQLHSDFHHIEPPHISG